MSKIDGEPDDDFYVGQRVKILEGAWIDFTGVISNIELEKKKAKILINFWGKDTSVELEFNQIKPLS
jgi:transcriptional antiterminator NusG